MSRQKQKDRFCQKFYAFSIHWADFHHKPSKTNRFSSYCGWINLAAVNNFQMEFHTNICASAFNLKTGQTSAYNGKI